MRLIVLFVLVPFVELYLLLKLAEWTSAGLTFALVVITGVVGATLARRQGFGVIQRLRNELQRGDVPTTTLADALMVFVAGALLITPGVLTDLVGFSLLVPACRRVYRGLLVRWFRQHVTVVGAGPAAARGRETDATTIDSYVVPRPAAPNSSDLPPTEPAGNEPDEAAEEHTKTPPEEMPG